MHARELELLTPSNSPVITPAARQGAAIVSAQPGDREWLLDDGSVAFTAQRAASCLLEPEVGDRVWFVAEGEQRYVIAVLQRDAQAGSATLRMDGDATLKVEGQLTLSSDELRIHARLGRVLLSECTAVLKTMTTHVTTSTLVGKVIETVADRLTQASKTSFRSVSEIDQLQAGAIDHRAQEVMHLAGDKVLVNGGELAKVEAGQIHLG